MNQHVNQDANGARRKTTGLVLGLGAFLMMGISPTPGDLSVPGWHVAGLTVLMAVWWMTEAVPLSVTALLPIVFLPLIGLKTFDQTAASYAHPLVFLFLGGFLIAKSIERWGLHSRIAASIAQLAPHNPAGMIGALMLATAFLRNSHVSVFGQLMQIITQRLGPSLEITENTAAVLFFIVRCAWVLVGHAVPQGVVEQNSDLACSGCHRLGLAGPCCQSSIKGSQCRVTSANRNSGQPQ